MNIRMMLVAIGLGLATQASADSRGGVWVYQPDGGSYRVESGPRVYDPRSPYSIFLSIGRTCRRACRGNCPRAITIATAVMMVAVGTATAVPTGSLTIGTGVWIAPSAGTAMTGGATTGHRCVTTVRFSNAATVAVIDADRECWRGRQVI